MKKLLTIITAIIFPLSVVTAQPGSNRDSWNSAPAIFEGSAKRMNAIIKFPSKEAAVNCYNDPLYEDIKKIRINSTENCTMVLVKQLNR